MTEEVSIVWTFIFRQPTKQRGTKNSTNGQQMSKVWPKPPMFVQTWDHWRLRSPVRSIFALHTEVRRLASLLHVFGLNNVVQKYLMLTETNRLMMSP